MWEEPSVDNLVNNACFHLTMILGGWARRGNSPVTVQARGTASSGGPNRQRLRDAARAAKHRS